MEVDEVRQEGQLIITEVVIAWKGNLLVNHVTSIVWGLALIRTIKQLLHSRVWRKKQLDVYSNLGYIHTKGEGMMQSL